MVLRNLPNRRENWSNHKLVPALVADRYDGGMLSFLTRTADELTGPVEAVGNVLDALFTSDKERLDKKAVLARIAQQPRLIQGEINKIEAAHKSVFVAGWRPFIGWVCG